MRLAFVTLAALVSLSGCIEEEKTAGTVEGDAPSCGAEDLQGIVGKAFDASLIPPETKAVRVVRPGMVVTMDYRSDRLNVELNDEDVIVKVTCG
ncbi:hypothetical protein GLS40_00795 [Pseudooceanicola sp. 216_PA32_1]|uniref:Peptidase inhibitor I78 family protein n=1 Tax=Pseudooceanicola pacificus TaxID=2676438 RepID=A0A844W1H2_9RHOB|nr:I78 family peptidase inhibitor [Pseudooceanicola pacificus]MWB76554.1 hypothetical protein [Pseudooceanicola pacificus]